MAKQGYPESLNCWLRDYPKYIKVTFGEKAEYLDGPWSNGSVIFLERIGIDPPDTDPVGGEIPPDIKVTYSDNGTDSGWIFKMGMYGWGTFFTTTDPNYYIDLEKFLEIDSDYANVKKFRDRTVTLTQIPKSIALIPGGDEDVGSSGYAHYTYNDPLTPAFSAVSSAARYIGYRQGRHQDIYTRFQAVAAQNEHPIIQALYYITLSEQQVTSLTMEVYGANSDNAPSVADESEWLSAVANLTTAYTTFHLDTGTLPIGTLIPIDVTNIIQEIVDRAGWEPGNTLGLFVIDDADETTEYIQINHSASYTYLHLVYEGIEVPDEIIYDPPEGEPPPDPVDPPPIETYWDTVARKLVSYYSTLLNLDANYVVDAGVTSTSYAGVVPGRQIGPLTALGSSTITYHIWGSQILIAFYSVSIECEDFIVGEPVDCTYSSELSSIYAFTYININGVNRLPELVNRV